MRVCHGVKWHLSEELNVTLSLPKQFNRKSVQKPASSTLCPACSKDYGPGDVLQEDNAWPQRARVVDNFLQHPRVVRMNWLARSGNINP